MALQYKIVCCNCFLGDDIDTWNGVLPLPQPQNEKQAIEPIGGSCKWISWNSSSAIILLFGTENGEREGLLKRRTNRPLKVTQGQTRTVLGSHLIKNYIFLFTIMGEVPLGTYWCFFTEASPPCPGSHAPPKFKYLHCSNPISKTLNVKLSKYLPRPPLLCTSFTPFPRSLLLVDLTLGHQLL